MELSNNAIKIYRESVEFRRVNCAEATPTTKCLRSYNVLSQCLFQNKLNILDHDGTDYLSKLCVPPARLTNGSPNALELSVVSTLNACTLEVSSTDYILNSSWTLTCR